MATISEENFSKKSDFGRIAANLYENDAIKAEKRFSALFKMHRDVFGKSPEAFFSSPGRIEIVGNHTDHNGGRVLAAAVTVDTLAAIKPRPDGIIEVKSKGYPMLRADSAEPKFCESESGTSNALIKGVCDYYLKNGLKTGGFSAVMDSCVPKGAGVSSSSSFELIIAEILNVLYNGGKINAITKAKASQYAENTYFGKPCGLMDQSAIALGGVNKIDFASFEAPKVEKAEWRFNDIDIYIINTGGDHSHLTDDYAAIPAEMKAVAGLLGGGILNEVPSERFFAEKEELKGRVSDRAILRAEHFYEENERVDRAFHAIESGDEEEFLKTVNESGLSSEVKLQNLYSEYGGRNLIEALDKVQRVDGVLAKRVHGGGFAGTILVFAKRGGKVKRDLNALFGADNVFGVSVRESGAEML